MEFGKFLHFVTCKQVTLSIENPDGSLTPSGWSTRKEVLPRFFRANQPRPDDPLISQNGGDGRPFEFTPGRNLIQGWTEGVLQVTQILARQG
jgi:hypothetical protein